MKLSKAVEQFLANSLIIKSSGTFEYEQQHLKVILKYFGDIELSTLKIETVYNYIINYKDKKISNATINKRLTLFKRLYKYVGIECPFNKIGKLKEDFITFGTISKSTMNKLNKALPSLPLRDQVIIRILRDTGIRLRELSYLTWDCINIEERIMNLVVTKNKRPRSVYFTVETQAVLYNWHSRTKSPYNTSPKYVILSNKFERLSPIGIEQVFRRLRKHLGITDMLSPHRFRHTLSTEIYHESTDLMFIQRILGHSNLDITKRYIHTNAEKDLVIYDKVRKKDE